MQAKTAIDIDSGLAKQLGELSGRLTASQVHLEKAILRMRETRRIGNIAATCGRDRHEAFT